MFHDLILCFTPIGAQAKESALKADAPSSSLLNFTKISISFYLCFCPTSNITDASVIVLSALNCLIRQTVCLIGKKLSCSLCLILCKLFNKVWQFKMLILISYNQNTVLLQYDDEEVDLATSYSNFSMLKHTKLTKVYKNTKSNKMSSYKLA